MVKKKFIAVHHATTLQDIYWKMKNNFTIKHENMSQHIYPFWKRFMHSSSITHLHCPGTFLSQIPAQPRHVGFKTFLATRHHDALAIGGLLE
jgi:hypothetical protein